MSVTGRAWLSRSRKLGRTSPSGQTANFGTARRHVWNAAMTRHSAPNVGNAPVSEAGIVSAACMQVSGRHQVKKTEICRWGSDNENWRRVGGTPGGGGRRGVRALPRAAPVTTPSLPAPVPAAHTTPLDTLPRGRIVRLRGSPRLRPPAQVLSRGIPAVASCVGPEGSSNASNTGRGGVLPQRCG